MAITPIERLYDFNSSELLNPDTGGGGGGGNSAPISNPPSYVPPVDQNPLKIQMSTNNGSAVEFFEDSKSKGFGVSTFVVHNPSTAFGSRREYTASINNGKVLSKFIVAIIKFDSFNYDGTSQYTEGIRVIEYKWENEQWVEQPFPRTFNFTSGTITLNFNVENVKTLIPTLPIETEIVQTTISTANPNSQIEMGFFSNLQNELSNSLTLSYQIVYGGSIIDSGNIEMGNNIFKELSNQILDNASVNFEVKGNTPDGIFVEQIYSGISSQYNGDFSRLNKVPYAFTIPASQLKNTVLVVVDAGREVKFAEPKITLGRTQYTIAVKESDTEKPVAISFNTENADRVLVYIDSNNAIEVPASNGSTTLYFQKDFKEIYGTKKVILVAESNNYGTGQKAEVLVTFTAINDFPSITETIVADLIDVPSFSDFNIEYEVKYSTFAATSVDVWLKQKDGTKIGLMSNQSPNGSLKINLKTLRESYPNWIGSDTVTLILKPYNRGGAEELIGNEYEVVTKLTLPTLQLDEDILSTALFQAFAEKISVVEPEPDSKYLTHLANFGNDEQIIVSSWENDNWTLSKKSEDELGNVYVKDEDVVESIILKLYSPIPSNVVNNSTFWITKLMTNPLIETVILNEQDELKCPPLKGPNFDIEVDFVTGQSTNFESLDNLILSGSSSSNELIGTYLSSSFIDTSDLNIEYVSGSTYAWDNFVHFSSAKERVDNFVYKVQLIETYEELILSSSADSGANISGSLYGYDLYPSTYTGSIAARQDVERNKIKKQQLIQGFDGFEKFLYTSSSTYTTSDSSSITWPYNNGVRLSSTDIVNVRPWYDNIITLAEDFDIENQNWVQNNIPQYIVNNDDNDSLLLFFSMIGQHFDNIYYHTKAIEKSRGLGYKSKDGISDKLLFDVLQSFGWDAKNLAADTQLWNYVFGLDKDGNTKETNPAKQRTYEVWRRIVNNLPYLLKHKGTRRGVYALLSCYGIPSSNLSILEFGGPEVTEITKSKLVVDNITTALKLNDGASIELDWRTTDKNRKPNTIELFVKPNNHTNYQTLISGSDWSLQLSGSTNTDYGKIAFNYSGSTALSSSLLPIFNGNFFGISISSGSNGVQLNVRQADKERTIFEEAISSSVNTNWNNGSKIKIGGTYSGSLDEFRLWSDVLDTQRFYEHVSFPEMINGNHISSSTDDLYFRLDFEYPKNLYATSSLINVDTNVYFENGYNRNDYESGSLISLHSTNVSASLYASASGFVDIATYPFQFEAIDRTIVMEMPDLGAGRYSTNKVRFESQELVSDLSHKSRATKKAFDQSPTDSNRVGLFFSPTKELNMDIAKSFGGINLDNYIGDPSDNYKPNYKRLDNLRNYYFQRFDGRNIYEYINLIKLYEKSMFEDIKKMLPARVKATTGLLIEPHILERSKVAHKKPSGEDYQQESVIHYSDTTILSSENNQNEVTLDTTSEYNISSENNQYDAIIYTASVDRTIAENYQYESIYDYVADTDASGVSYQEEVSIDAKLDLPTILTEFDILSSNEVVGQTDYENIGFGIYAQSGSAIRTYFDKDGRRVKERVRVQLVTEQKEREVSKFKIVIGGKGDPRGGYELTSSVYTETKLNIQPFSGSTPPTIGGDIIAVKQVDGYLPTHNKFTSDLTTGLKNSYYLGSKNTAATTLDGSSPIETFVSNPNTLKVNKAGRASNEPILETE